MEFNGSAAIKATFVVLMWIVFIVSDFLLIEKWPKPIVIANLVVLSIAVLTGVWYSAYRSFHR